MFRKLVGLLTVAVTGLFLSGVASAQLSGTGHDLTGLANVDGICEVCHAPHNPNHSISTAPLWDHELAATTGFTPYTSPNNTLDATDVAQPAGMSRMCLGCHDGLTSLDNFGGTDGGTKMLATAPGYVGLDLSDDHPVSFTYSDGLASTDGSLHTPSTKTTSLGGTIAAELLFAGELECGSCHDVHDTSPSAGGKFLRVTNAGSLLCLECHNK